MKNNLLIRGGTVVTPQGLLKEGYVLIKDGKIVEIGHTYANGLSEDRVVTIDAGNKYVLPGFIDVHVHGGGGGDVMDGSFEALHSITQTHARYGTTGLLATTMTADVEPIHRCLDVVSQFIEQQPSSGAAILGIHLEGPFIHPKYKGAQNEKWIRSATVEELKKMVDSARGQLKWITMAPELVESDEIFEWLQSHNLVCSIGHSSAGYNDVCKCIRHGFSHVTHLFNAMPPLHHREVGVIGAALIRDELSYEVIADGIHVSPEALQMLVRSGTMNKMLLVTDAIRAAGLDEGEYELGGQPVYVKNGQARLQDDTLAGSVLTMNQAVRNMMKFTGIPLESAVSLGTLHPARKLGVDDRKGSIEIGKDADLVVTDEDFNVEMTFVQGNAVFQREGE
jgi:N-acetylglucosamine-6-phosphate deacetylase